MRSGLARFATAFVLTGSIWLGSLPSVSAQQPQNTGSQSTTGQQPSSQNIAKADPSPTPLPPPSKGGPLSTNEDPSMIGKRNINTSIVDKMSGSIEKEVALGHQLAAQVDRESKFIDDPVITEYINRVGQNIVLHSDAKIPFTIKVIDSDEVNAFSLPGGFLYINKGLILAADNEAELAGVMGHEIAHVAARHAVENAAKMRILDYGLLAGIIFSGGIGGMVLQNVGGLGEMLAFMKFSRGNESEADRLGVQYLYAAGYDPNGMASMFEKIEALNKKKPGRVSRAFSSHPQPPDRRAASIALVARFPEREEYVVSTSEFQRVKAKLLRLSNARATSSGDLSGGPDGTGRPTLKRRTPAPDDPSSPSTSPTTNDGTDQKVPDQVGPPKLKRNDSTPQPTPTP